LPSRLAVAWTVTGLRGAGAAPIAVTARTEVEAGGERAAGAERAPVPGGDPEGEPRAGGGLLRAGLAGALLALNPTSLALLVLLAGRPIDARRRSAPPLLAAAAMSASLVGLQVAARTRGVAAPLEEPVAVAALALPALLLALVLWAAPATVERRVPATLAHLAPLLAAPVALVWLPLAGWSAAPPVPVAMAMSVGFALPFLGAALAAGRAPRPSPRLLVVLGFVAALTPVWAAYRLSLVLPAHRLAGVELSWVALALALRAGSTSAGFGRVLWSLLAVAAAGIGVWLA
jgi:hypothetical protein